MTEEVKDKEKERTVFDTEMIRAATHQKNRVVEFFMTNGDEIRGIPITIDKNFILIAVEENHHEEWIAKDEIVRCRIEKVER